MQTNYLHHGHSSRRNEYAFSRQKEHLLLLLKYPKIQMKIDYF